jgi:hypothetical protein
MIRFKRHPDAANKSREGCPLLSCMGFGAGAVYMRNRMECGPEKHHLHPG